MVRFSEMGCCFIPGGLQLIGLRGVPHSHEPSKHKLYCLTQRIILHADDENARSNIGLNALVRLRRLLIVRCQDRL